MSLYAPEKRGCRIGTVSHSPRRPSVLQRPCRNCAVPEVFTKQCIYLDLGGSRVHLTLNKNIVGFGYEVNRSQKQTNSLGNSTEIPEPIVAQRYTVAYRVTNVPTFQRSNVPTFLRSNVPTLKREGVTECGAPLVAPFLLCDGLSSGAFQ